MTALRDTTEPSAPRMLPELTDTNRAFWTAGATGHLAVPRCRACRRWTLPPVDSCPACGGVLGAEPVSGRGRVLTWTVNAHQFHPDIPPPYVIAIVTLEEQDDLRLATNLVDCDEDAIRSDLPVAVRFEQHGEVYYPVFTPAASE